MGRYYRLSKKITDDMATAILNEINELENVQTARITEDNKYLFVDTKDQQYPEVMTRALNICSRLGGKCELSFAGFEGGFQPQGVRKKYKNPDLRNITWLVRTAKNPDFLILLFFINGYFVHAAYTEQLVFLIICEVLF